MNHSDIAALMRGVAPVIAELVAKTAQPLVQKIAALEQEVAELRSVDHAATVADLVSDAIDKLPAPAPGKDADPEVIRQMVADAVALIPSAKDGDPGKDADPDLVEQLVTEKVAAAVAEIEPPAAGKDADPDVTAELVRVEVERAVAALPVPQDGKSVTVEELAPLVDEAVTKAVAALPPAEKGEPGTPGTLPMVKAWTDDVTHEGEVRTHGGATWQATKDTAKEPPHADWICLASAGRDGVDGRSFRIRGTHAEGSEYTALDVVSLNGGAFVAKKDDPGPCPGDGWQLIASQGKRGQPGERGLPGRGDKGAAGEPLVAGHIDDQGMLTLVNGDGSKVEIDLYPVLAKVQS